MAKLWTAQERKLLHEVINYIGGNIITKKKQIIAEYRKKNPTRSPHGISAQLLLIRREQKRQENEGQQRITLDAIPAGIGMPPLMDKLMYNPSDVAFTRPVTRTDIIRHYRDMGLRGKITLDLGE